MAKKKSTARRTTPAKSKPVVPTLAQRLAKELLAVGNEKGFRPCHRIEFKVRQRKDDPFEFASGGLCQAALVNFFEKRLP